MKPPAGWVYAAAAFLGGYLFGTALWLAPDDVALGTAVAIAAFAIGCSLRISIRTGGG